MAAPVVAIITPTKPGREDLLLRFCIPSVEAQKGPFRVRHIIISDYNPPLMQHLTASERVYQIEPYHLSPDWRHFNPTWKDAPGAYPYHLGALIAGAPDLLEAAGFGLPAGQVAKLADLSEEVVAIGYLGDDDEYLPGHIETCLYGLLSRNVDLVISKGDFRLTDLDEQGSLIVASDPEDRISKSKHLTVIGSGRIENGGLDTNGIFHRRIALDGRNVIKDVANWRVPSPNPHISDLTFVQDLCARGLPDTPAGLAFVPPIKWGFVDEVTYRHYDGGPANGTVIFQDPLGRRDEHGRPIRLLARDFLAVRESLTAGQSCLICGRPGCPGHPGWEVADDAPGAPEMPSYVQHLGSPDGGLAPDELAALIEFSRHKRVLEIGTQHGFSTIQMAGKALSVDTVDWHRGLGDDDTLGAFWGNVRAAKMEHKITANVGRSVDVLPLFAAGQFDLVYVDGGHSYEDALFDLTQARRLVKKGGIVAAHDCGNQDWPGVERAWVEVFGAMVPRGTLAEMSVATGGGYLLGQTLACWRLPSVAPDDAYRAMDAHYDHEFGPRDPLVVRHLMSCHYCHTKRVVEFPRSRIQPGHARPWPTEEEYRCGCGERSYIKIEDARPGQVKPEVVKEMERNARGLALAAEAMDPSLRQLRRENPENPESLDLT